jgi:hypothetical protein
MKKLFRLRMLFRGDSELSVVLGLGVASLFAVALGGLFYTPEKSQTAVPINSTTQGYPAYTCCDTGDGSACKLVPGKTITYNGNTFGLLRSNLFVSEGQHLEPTSESTPTGERIFYIKDSGGGDVGMEPRSNQDVLYGGESDQNPNLIPKNTLIYVCRSGYDACSQNAGRSIFDGYWKVGVPIPSAISSCNKRPIKDGVPYKPNPTYPATNTGQIVVTPTGSPSKNSLQIGTFNIEQTQTDAYIADWLTPYCKPAVYLYPQQTTDVHVVLNPQGKLNLTIPQYPPEGWSVTAHTNGDIFSNGKQFDYLYYEAKLSDQKIIPPSSGYVMSYADLGSRLPQIVTQYGLNTKEKDQFVEYWMKVLPQSPYYFVGIMPENELDMLSPLTISPKPDHIRRVTLYFQALEKPISVSTPAPFATFTRSGFSVVEWGGIFKKDPKYPFSCFM